VREAAARGLKLFPVSQLAKLTNPDSLIAEATSDIFRLEELADAAQPLWGYRLAVGPSGLCIWRVDGPMSRGSLSALVPDLDECLTLQARCGDAILALFKWPQGLVLRSSSRRLVTGVRILGDGDSCIIPPSGGCVWLNPWAEIEDLPYSLRDLAFETPDTPGGKAVTVPALSRRPTPCRSRAQFENPQRGVRKGYPICGQAGWRGGYRISRQS
jgi:hypothetical protein